MAVKTAVILLVSALNPLVCSPQPATLDYCLASIGLPGADKPAAWTAHVSLTVSQQRDASLITFDRSGEEHSQYLIFGVLRSLTFKKACIEKQLTFRVRWEPSRDGSYGVAIKAGELVITGYATSGGRERHGGPLEINNEDLKELSRTPSLREFFRRKRINPEH